MLVQLGIRELMRQVTNKERVRVQGVWVYSCAKQADVKTFSKTTHGPIVQANLVDGISPRDCAPSSLRNVCL